MGADDLVTITASGQDPYIPPQEESNKEEQGTWRRVWSELQHTFTTRQGLIGDYDYAYLFTPALSGMRILATIPWSRRNRLILSASFGLGLLDIGTSEWFSKVLDYIGPNVHLMGFREGVNLIVETPFILSRLVAVLLNFIMPRERRETLPLDPASSGGSSTENVQPKREQ